MKCKSCQSEYHNPDIVNDIAYFVCSSCGNVYEVKNYKPYTKDQIIGKIGSAFSGVVLGQGTGLLEAQAIDDYESEEVQKSHREKDEKINWSSISYEVLRNNQSSLSFFNADGMKFHLPAYIIESLKGELDAPLFYLTHLGSHMEAALVTLNAAQNRAIMEYLTWCLTEDEYSFEHADIIKSLNECWEKSPKST